MITAAPPSTITLAIPDVSRQASRRDRSTVPAALGGIIKIRAPACSRLAFRCGSTFSSVAIQGLSGPCSRRESEGKRRVAVKNDGLRIAARDEPGRQDCGSSLRTVPMPIRMASCSARRRWVMARDSVPLSVCLFARTGGDGAIKTLRVGNSDERTAVRRASLRPANRSKSSI